MPPPDGPPDETTDDAGVLPRPEPPPHGEPSQAPPSEGTPIEGPVGG